MCYRAYVRHEHVDEPVDYTKPRSFWSSDLWGYGFCLLMMSAFVCLIYFGRS